MQSTPQERGPERIPKQVVDIPVPPVMEEIMAVGQEEVKWAPTERVQQPTVEQVPMPVPRSMEVTVDVALVPHERGAPVDAPMPHVLEETVQAGRLVPHERVEQRTAKQIVDVPQFLEVVRLVSQEQVQRIHEWWGCSLHTS